MTQLDPKSIRRRTLAALAGNRAPGFHFPGYFLGLEWPRVAEREVVLTMEAGTHCLDANGSADPAALGVLVDGALATAARLAIEPGARLATVHLKLQYTGHRATGALSAEAMLEGFYEGDAVRHAITRGVLTTSGGEAVCYAGGTFLLLPAPPGVALAPLPWQQAEAAPVEPLTLRELTAAERGVVRAADRALAASDGAHAFIERFFGVLPKAVTGGAACRVKIGPQIGNRVGHVQGGILLGLAQATASAAVPGHPAVSTVSAWYISPGQGKSLTVRSKVVHVGRSFAVVRTEVRNADRSLVLEAMSNHASVRKA
ncbi:MAG TPA: acyl-CoA thioesterase domain-containing protein [Burkholderiales bacterium]|nr:acyl-CoA thioesterase domain-containing protein [Burkholderiales bacterium]